MEYLTYFGMADRKCLIMCHYVLAFNCVCSSVLIGIWTKNVLTSVFRDFIRVTLAMKLTWLIVCMDFVKQKVFRVASLGLFSTKDDTHLVTVKGTSIFYYKNIYSVKSNYTLRQSSTIQRSKPFICHSCLINVFKDRFYNFLVSFLSTGVGILDF